VAEAVTAMLRHRMSAKTKDTNFLIVISPSALKCNALHDAQSAFYLLCIIYLLIRFVNTETMPDFRGNFSKKLPKTSKTAFSSKTESVRGSALVFWGKL
jgi:hypothetical protein